jgi:hypothetical protein
MLVMVLLLAACAPRADAPTTGERGIVQQQPTCVLLCFNAVRRLPVDEK